MALVFNCSLAFNGNINILEGHRPLIDEECIVFTKAPPHSQGIAGILNVIRNSIDSIEHRIFMAEKSIRVKLSVGTLLMLTLAELASGSISEGGGIPDCCH